MSTITFDFRHYYRKGERRESDQIAYQWDLGHVAEIYVPVNATYEIHYCFADFTETDDYAVESTTAAEDGGYKLTAHIPNKYFERSGELKVYVIGSDDNHVLTTYEGYISIRGRIKPDDYTDDDPENEATRILAEAREARDAAIEAAEQAEAAASQSAAQASIAEVYDTTKTYAIGDYCLHDGQLYECTTEITTPEAWTAAHWTAATVGTELNDIKGDVTGLKEDIVKFVADCPSEGYDINALVENGIWTIRDSRKSACTNLPSNVNGYLTVVVQKTKTNIVLQKVYDSDGNVWVRTVNASTYDAITDWTNGLSASTGNSTVIGMTQKAVTDVLATKVGYEQFSVAYIDGQRTIQRKTLTSKSGANVVQSNNDYYTTYKYEIFGMVKFRVTGKLKGSSNYMFITATATNGFVDRQLAGASAETQYTNQEYTVNDSTVKYVYICLYGRSDEDIAAQSVQIQSVKSQYDTEQDANIEKLAAYGNRFIGKKIVCFGDSRTWYDGHEYTDKAKTELQGETCVGYQQQIRDILGATVISEGVSGETSAEICTRVRAFDFTGYDAVLLEGGVNDFVKSSTVTIGEIAPIGSTFDTSTVYGAWQSAIEYIATNYPLVKIYMDIPAIAWLGSNDDVFPYAVAKIKGEIAELYSLPCKDLYKTSGINKVNRDAFYCDDTSLTNNWHLHFNDAGNALIGAELAMFINDN